MSTPKRQRRAAQMRVYREVTVPFIMTRDNYQCRECGAPGTDPHHVYGRSGWRLNDTDHIILLCHYHHELAGKNLKESRPKHLEILKEMENNQ